MGGCGRAPRSESGGSTAPITPVPAGARGSRARGTHWSYLLPCRPRHGRTTPCPGPLDPGHEGGGDCCQQVPPASGQAVPRECAGGPAGWVWPRGAPLEHAAGPAAPRSPGLGSCGEALGLTQEPGGGWPHVSGPWKTRLRGFYPPSPNSPYHRTPRSSSHCPTGSCVASTSHASPPRGPTPSSRCRAPPAPGLPK